jgi:hypothetical protein
VIVVFVSGSFESADDGGEQKPCDEGDREFAPVMGVKLQFGQQVTTGDAQERAGGKSQGRTEKEVARLGKLGRPKMESDHPRWNRQGEERIDEMTGHP